MVDVQIIVPRILKTQASIMAAPPTNAQVAREKKPRAYSSPHQPLVDNPHTAAMVPYTNACCLANKWLELETEANGIDIIAKSETWLRPETDVANNFQPNYHIYQTDRVSGQHGSGMLLLIRDNYLQLGCFSSNLPGT